MAKNSIAVTATSPVQQHYFKHCLPWQEESWQRLVSRFPKIPHAILLSGMPGTGKRAFADQLAAWLLCLNRNPQQACSECSSCQWLKADTHPSLLRVSPEVDNKGKTSQFIKIDQIRELMPFVQQTGKGWRVIIIEPAESLNIAAANALLKTLEEPGEQVTLILVSDQPLQLPATIRSRLQQYRVGDVNSQQALDFLNAQARLNTHGHLSEQQNRLLLNLSSGAPLAALALVEQPAFIARQDWITDWQKLLEQHLSPMTLSSNWQKRLSLTEWLKLLQWMIRDAIAAHLSQPVCQTDLDFNPVIKKINVEQLFNLQQQILRAIQGQTQNIQSSLVYDTLMMQLMNLPE
jgi:DNA polymerase-3 subunit delta'